MIFVVIDINFREPVKEASDHGNHRGLPVPAHERWPSARARYVSHAKPFLKTFEDKGVPVSMTEHRSHWSRFVPLFVCLLLIPVSFLSQLSILPVARAQAATRMPNTTVGQLNTSGDPTFDSDSIANSDASQWRWLSYPGARLTFNPGNPGLPDTRLTLNAGGWFGNSQIHLNTLVQAQLAPQGEARVPPRASAAPGTRINSRTPRPTTARVEVPSLATITCPTPTRR